MSETTVVNAVSELVDGSRTLDEKKQEIVTALSVVDGAFFRCVPYRMHEDALKRASFSVHIDDAGASYPSYRSVIIDLRFVLVGEESPTDASSPMLLITVAGNEDSSSERGGMLYNIDQLLEISLLRMGDGANISPSEIPAVSVLAAHEAVGRAIIELEQLFAPDLGEALQIYRDAANA